LRIDREHLETIFANLCDNALQHGASTFHIGVKLSAEEIFLRISDNGRGISGANKDKIFTPFFTTRRQDGGTGLGLGIIQSLLHAHDGSIRIIDSDTGACFEMKIIF